MGSPRKRKEKGQQQNGKSRVVYVSWTKFNVYFQRLPWVYCTGQAGVEGNDQADHLADKPTVENLEFRSQVLRSLKHYQEAQKPKLSHQ